MDNLPSPNNITSGNKAFERLGKLPAATLTLHCWEDLSCMHCKNGSAAMGRAWIIWIIWQMYTTVEGVEYHRPESAP